MLAALFAATLIAAAPLDAAHAAVLQVISSGDDGAACEPAKRRAMAARAQVRKLGRAGGQDVVLAEVFDSCICGAANCPVYAIRLSPGKPRVLFSAFSNGVTVQAATPLPRVVVRMHDSAAVSYETTYAFRNGTYEAADAGRVRGDGARKPIDVPVRFAPGSSSAALHGTASLGWDDAYAFAAGKGQTVLIDGVRSKAKVRLTMYGPDAAGYYPLRAGEPFVLPAAGTYRLHVETDSESDVPYALTLAIR